MGLTESRSNNNNLQSNPITNDDQKQDSKCPFVGKEEQLDPRNNMSPPNQQPSPGQPFPLDKQRQVSSIKKFTETGEEDKWIYPSEQMFWNAMLKKGWRWETSQISPNDMTNIIRIHNRNNEEAWNEICKWERLSGFDCSDIKLKKFSGLATKYSPKARIRQILGYELPFDRHDWIIDRNGQEVRYIIDYYDVGSEEDYKKGDFVHMDIRPAFDSVDAIVVRTKAAFLRQLSSLYMRFKEEEN